MHRNTRGRRWHVVGGALALCATMALCACGLAQGPQVVAAAMCTQVNASGEPLDVTEDYPADAPSLHCSVRVQNARGRLVRAVFVAEDALQQPDYVIEELALPAEGSHALDFALNRDARPWPPGRYRVDVYLDDRLATTVPFRILQPAVTPTAPPTATPVPPTPTPEMRVEVAMARGPQEHLTELAPPVVYATDEAAFYCLVTISAAPSDTTVRVRWIAVDALPETNHVLQENGYLVTGDGRLAFPLQRDGGPWPTGRYAVELHIGDELVSRQEFAVHE